jgi:hypothetical protein
MPAASRGEIVMRIRDLWFKSGWVVAAWLGLSALAFAQGTADSGAYQILQARYGTAERHVDVTDRLRELARLDRAFQMGNDTFGTDPDPGRVKVLRVYARSRDGRAHTFEFVEGSIVDGAQFSGWSAGQWGRGRAGGWNDGPVTRVGADGGEHRIVQALYGTARRNVDVTQRLAELAAQSASFVVGNDAMGADPDYGQPKTLRIFTRSRGGQQRMFEFAEGSTVDGAQFAGWRSGGWGFGERPFGWGGAGAVTGLAIVNASYGSGGQRIDVTERVRAQLRGDRIELVAVDNQWAGIDPAPGMRKTLWLIYTLGGRMQYAEVPEGTRVSLP